MPKSTVSSRGHKQSSIARGMYWSTQVSSLAFEMVFPVGIGLWLDKKLGWLPWLTVIGAIVGFSLLLTHLIALTKPTRPSTTTIQTTQTNPTKTDSPVE